MSLMGKKKVKVNKEVKDNDIIFFVDYFRLKESKEFKLGLIRDLIGENQCLVVINTNLAYMKASEKIEKEVNEITKLLDEQAISFKKVITKKDESYSILGFPINSNKTKKVTNYIIGFIMSVEDIKKIERIIDRLNVNYFINVNETNTEEILDRFYSTNGDMDELNELFHYNVYNDNFFNRIAIHLDKEKIEFVEEVLQRHVSL